MGYGLTGLPVQKIPPLIKALTWMPFQQAASRSNTVGVGYQYLIQYGNHSVSDWVIPDLHDLSISFTLSRLGIPGLKNLVQEC